MLTIKVSSGDPALSKLFLRQSPGGKGIWRNCRFIVNEKVDRCDWWVVCHNTGLINTQTVECDPAHLIYISMEPDDSDLPHKFLDQFSKLVICDRKIVHPSIIYKNGLTWWVGIKVKVEYGHIFDPKYLYDYDSFCKIAIPDKKKRISVIVTNQKDRPGHKKRIEFLEKVKQHSVGSYVDIYGGGFAPIPDKWDAIAPYKYNLVLENSIVPDYWSEKLADSFLGFALPIYYGCPNILDYFPPESLCVINIEDFKNAIEVLDQLIQTDPYEIHAPSILQARHMVLNHFNLFQVISDICNTPSNSYERCKLKPVENFKRSLPRRFARKLIYRLRGLKAV